MFKIKNLTALILPLLIVGCSRAMEAPMEPLAAYDAPGDYELVEMEEAADYDGGYDSSAGTGAANNSADVERLIIRNGSLSIVAPDTKTALDDVTEMANELGGYVVESNVYKYQEGLQASVMLRVPAESFDTALAHIRDLATEVRSESTSGQDVTEDYVDLKSRLRYLEATEARLLEFLEDAEDTESALAVYEQLQQIQADIEHVKGRMQYLEQSAAMATINLDIIPDAMAQPIQVAGWNPKGTARNAIQALVHVLQFLADATIVIILLVVPVLVAIAIPIAGLVFVVRSFVRWRRARKMRQATK